MFYNNFVKKISTKNIEEYLFCPWVGSLLLSEGTVTEKGTVTTRNFSVHWINNFEFVPFLHFY